MTKDGRPSLPQADLIFIEGDVAHEFEADDCLELGSPADCTFGNETDAVCTYLIAVVPR
jgi:hypothetical protein